MIRAFVVENPGKRTAMLTVFGAGIPMSYTEYWRRHPVTIPQKQDNVQGDPEPTISRP